MCGSTSSQKEILSGQKDLFGTLTGNYKEMFGSSMGIFKSLTSTFTPILEAGVNQQGFSPAELAARNTQATEGTSAIYDKALAATNKQIAAEGGGNEYIPSGAADQRREEVGVAAASQEAAMKNAIQQENYATGRENFFNAAKVLGSAPSVMNTAAGYANEATGAGQAAEKTANDIAQADNAFWGSVMGMVGGVASAALTGGLSGGMTSAFGGMSPGAISGSFGGPTSASTVLSPTEWHI